MLNLIQLKCNWIQYDNIACGTLIGICQILRDQGIPDDEWEMYQGRKQMSSGTSFHAIANIGLPTKHYAPDYLWPNLPFDTDD